MSRDNYHWQPLPQGTIIPGDKNRIVVGDFVHDDILWIAEQNGEDVSALGMLLPDDVRLCREVPAPAPANPQEVDGALVYMLCIDDAGREWRATVRPDKSISLHYVIPQLPGMTMVVCDTLDCPAAPKRIDLPEDAYLSLDERVARILAAQEPEEEIDQ